MTDLATIRAREADPGLDERAQRVSDKIFARIDQQRVRMFGRMAQVLPNPADKLQVLNDMAGELGKAARDLVPCSRGCSKCCHMATMLTAQEATLIAQQTGARLAEPQVYFSGADGEHERYAGQPCPFLKNDVCSIYQHRPFACRVHVHIDRDNTLCQVVPGERIRVPMLDTMEFDTRYVAAFGGPFSAKLADIREFFPKGLDK
jgi:Fe-S-cluster containining protein